MSFYLTKFLITAIASIKESQADILSKKDIHLTDFNVLS